MTVGNLFLITIISIIVWLSLARFLYTKEIKYLTKMNYTDPKSQISFFEYAFLSFCLLFIIAIIIYILYNILINWNMPL